MIDDARKLFAIVLKPSFATKYLANTARPKTSGRPTRRGGRVIVRAGSPSCYHCVDNLQQLIPRNAQFLQASVNFNRRLKDGDWHKSPLSVFPSSYEQEKTDRASYF